MAKSKEENKWSLFISLIVLYYNHHLQCIFYKAKKLHISQAQFFQKMMWEGGFLQLIFYYTFAYKNDVSK